MQKMIKKGRKTCEYDEMEVMVAYILEICLRKERNKSMKII